MLKHCGLLVATICSLIVSPANAAIVHGVSVFRNLVSFDSAAPGTLLTSNPITGLVDPFESIAGIDFRPATGQLYAWGNAPGSIYRLYTLDTATGVATRVGNVDFNLTGTAWGFDFNPVVDRIRIVNDLGANLRVNPNDGTLAGTDTNVTTGITAVAYDRVDINAATPTTLYGIDTVNDQLVRIGGLDGIPSPNDGAVTNIGALGIDAINLASFDIADTGVAYAALSITAPIPTSLYTVDLATGAVTSLGQIGDGSDGLTSMAVGISAVPEPTSGLVLALAGLTFGFRRRRSS